MSRSRLVATENARHCDHLIPESLDRTRRDSDVLFVAGGFDFKANSLKSVFFWAVRIAGPEYHGVWGFVESFRQEIMHLANYITLVKSVLRIVRDTDDEDVLTGLLEMGNQTMEMLRDLLNKAAKHMLDARDEDGSLGRNAGVAFVEIMCGTDTAELRAEIQRWLSQFHEVGGPTIDKWAPGTIQLYS